MNKKLLVTDILNGLKDFNNLKLLDSGTELLVSGKFTAFEKYAGKLIEIEEYDIEIKFPHAYPFRFPLVKEISGKIPNEPDRHKNNDGTLCFGNLPDELRYCKNGITFNVFLKKVLNEHLCREYVRERDKEYPTGERSHDTEGIWETYYDLLQTRDKQLIIEELDLILNNLHFEIKNKPCYCKSGKKYKRCHFLRKYLVLDIGINNIRSIIKTLKADTKNKI